MYPWCPLQRFEFSALLLHEPNRLNSGQQVLTRQPQELAHRAAHDHLAGALRNITCFEHGVILLDDALDPFQLGIGTETSFTNALGSLFGVFTVHSALCHSVADHQKIRLKSASRACIFVRVDPLRSKNTFGFQRATSAAHSYSGLPQCAPSTVIFGKRLAISSK